MKTRIAVVALIISTSSYADGPTAIHGFNENGEEIYMYVDGEVPVEGGTVDAYTVEVVKRGERRFETAEKYTRQDCGINAKIAYKPGFFCDRLSKSPLAGAEYAYAEELPGCGGSLLACKSGCSSRAPRELIIDPWECGEEEVAGCPTSDAVRGFISGDDVNVRENPASNSPVLRRVSFGTKVIILKRDTHCLVLNKRRGRWTKVKILDDEEIKEGWVYDAYIAYQHLAQ